MWIWTSDAPNSSSVLPGRGMRIQELVSPHSSAAVSIVSLGVALYTAVVTVLFLRLGRRAAAPEVSPA